MAGPVTKPRPKAAPTRPMERERCSRVVTSATAAVATDRLPLKAPLTTRDKRNSQKEPLNAQITYPKAVPATVRVSTGRRPQRSDKEPQNGAKINCRSE